MKSIYKMIAAFAIALTAQVSQAQVEAPIWNCALTFDIQGGGLKILVGSFTLQGEGQISCMDVAGNQEVIPVLVTMGGTPVSLGFGIGKLRLAGVAAGIGLAGWPSDLLGDYVVAGVRGSLGVGAGADLALHATHRSFTMNTSVQAVSGVGANLGFDFLTIERL